MELIKEIINLKKAVVDLTERIKILEIAAEQKERGAPRRKYK